MGKLRALPSQRNPSGVMPKVKNVSPRTTPALSNAPRVRDNSAERNSGGGNGAGAVAMGEFGPRLVANDSISEVSEHKTASDRLQPASSVDGDGGGGVKRPSTPV